MSKSLEINDINPIYGVDGNICLMASGSVAIAYEIEFPEIYTLDNKGFDEINSLFDKTLFTYLPENTVIQFQWNYKKEKYDSSSLKSETYLQRSTKKYFEGRMFLKQTCYVFFIMPKVFSYQKTYSSVILKKPKENKTIKKFSEVESFIDKIEKTVTILNSSDKLNLNEANEKNLVGYLKNVLHFNTSTYSDLQITSDGNLNYGDTKIKIYALTNDKSLPVGTMPTSKINKERSTDLSSFHRPLNNMGLELFCDHIVNLIICFDSQEYWKNRISSKINRLKNTRLFDSQNEVKATANEEFLQVLANTDDKLVRFHFNVMVWGKDEKNLKKRTDYIETAYASMGVKPYEPKKELFYFFKWSLPGNADQIPVKETIKSYGAFPFLFLSPESNYKDEGEGFLFNDRLTQLPLKIDTFDRPYKTKLIDNRNFVVIAPSGGGKSFLLKSKLRQFIEEENTKCVVVNIGGDDKICKTYKEDSLYFRYKEGASLGVNPFYVLEDTIHLSKIEFLESFIALLWKTGKEMSNDELSSLKKIVFDYYDAELKEDGIYTIKSKRERNVTDFHAFLLERKTDFEETMNLINMDSLILNLEKFATGPYSSLFTKGAPKSIDDKKYIEFELDNIKDHPILFPIFGMLISDLTFSTMWKEDGSKKMFFIDEAWKILEKPGMASLLKYLYKTIRKFTGSVGIAVQQASDIVNESLPSDIANAILGNTGVKFLLNHSNVTAEVPLLKKSLSLTDNMVSQLLSIRNNTKGDFPHTEFLLIMGTKSKVLRLEVSKEAYVIYESDKDQLSEFNEIYDKKQNIETTVKEYIKTYL